MRGANLTPEDVVYSLKRNMIVDADGGPMWMLLEALTGQCSTRDANGNIHPKMFETVDKAVEVKGDSVVFHLPRPYPPLMGILAFSASAILDKEWAVSMGCWDGPFKMQQYTITRPQVMSPCKKSLTAPVLFE